MREFTIVADFPNNVPFVTTDDDVLGVIGHLLSLVSQLDQDESVTIYCTDQE